jgi:hypothetical protein
MSNRKPLDGQIPLMIRTGMDDAQFEYLMECATLYADKIRETGMAPIQAMLIALLTFTLTGAACRAQRSDLREIIRENMSELHDIAEEFVRDCPVMNEDAMADGWRQRVGMAGPLDG